ncbi:hypothetical protein GUITHDRAFT_114778 [Guillardia theta CCMP2712]|uniref:Uncharacterized protein n=1 Tax=Guillardia theta (strain CCMP2712) TaxID=905079 RepID=L1ISN2_GUITC|nr:hypothetical protein GUITHDRAFT_114778 [Guillardia theta CCMP2712]EKX39117.1 hypothetical protein GUITHDRAFT_114778 [Guillardia theta CCMP2712]|eukprot:XP_005826097.1 hypothetical protein GUITHDRAFT_114778 [Guillardia theta CCMP2712]
MSFPEPKMKAGWLDEEREVVSGPTSSTDRHLREVEDDRRDYLSSQSIPPVVPPSLSASSMRFKQEPGALVSDRTRANASVELTRSLWALELAMGHQRYSILQHGESSGSRAQWKTLAILCGPYEVESMRAVDALRALGKEELVGALGGGYSEMRSKLIAALWSSKSSRVRQKICYLVQEFASGPDRSFIEEMMIACEDESPAVRAAAISCLNSLLSHEGAGDFLPQVLPLIKKRVRDDSAEVKKAALMALSNLAKARDVSTLMLLVESVENVNAEVSSTAQSSLLQIMKKDAVEYSRIEMKMSLITFVKSLAHTYRNDMLARFENAFGEFDINGERVTDPERVRTTLEGAIGNNIHQLAALSDLLSEPNENMSWEKFRGCLEVDEAVDWHPPLRVPSLFRLLWLWISWFGLHDIQSRCDLRLPDGRTKLFALVEDMLVLKDGDREARQDVLFDFLGRPLVYRSEDSWAWANRRNWLYQGPYNYYDAATGEPILSSDFSFSKFFAIRREGDELEMIDRRTDERIFAFWKPLFLECVKGSCDLTYAMKFGAVKMCEATEEEEDQTWSTCDMAMSDMEDSIGSSTRELCDSELMGVKYRAAHLDCSCWFQTRTRIARAQDKLIRELLERVGSENATMRLSCSKVLEQTDKDIQQKMVAGLFKRLKAETTTSHFDIMSLLVRFASDTSQKEDIILRALEMTRQELKHVRVAGLELLASLCEPKDTRLNELISQMSCDDDYAVRAIAFRLNH